MKMNTWSGFETDTIILDEVNGRFAVVPGCPPSENNRRATGEKLEKWVSVMGPGWKPIEWASSTEVEWMKKAT